MTNPATCVRQNGSGDPVKQFWIFDFGLAIGDSKSKIVCGFTFTCCLFLLGVSAQAQQQAKLPVIGHLSQGSYSTSELPLRELYRQELQKLGYVEGKTVAFEYRYAEENLDRLPDLARQLVQLKVDIIVGVSLPEIRAAMQATRTIPILMLATPSDPVGAGLVGSLARPGGNVTGLTTIARELGGKRLELLREVSPKISRLGYLGSSVTAPQDMRVIDPAAKALGIQTRSFVLRGSEKLENAFSEMNKERINALLVPLTRVILVHRVRIIEFATKRRLPSMFDEALFVEDGGLMSYGMDRVELYRRAAAHVDKILKGTKPSDIPVEQPMKFDFVINLKTAKQIGLSIPQWTLMKADRVIK